jgi:predicted nucleic-acid-binding Zn-ribbon protein
MTVGKPDRCPKCGGAMTPGTISGNLRILKQGDLVGDRANVLYCQDCGFVELYKEPSTKETRRWHVTPPEVSPDETRKKPKEPREDERRSKTEKRLVR